jgi:hypothetical protein
MSSSLKLMTKCGCPYHTFEDYDKLTKLGFSISYLSKSTTRLDLRVPSHTFENYDEIVVPTHTFENYDEVRASVSYLRSLCAKITGLTHEELLQWHISETLLR